MLRRFLSSNICQFKNVKSIHTSSIVRLREIVEHKKDEKTTIIEGKYIKSPRQPFLLKLDDKSGKCPLCQLKLNIKHTDVLILNQFVDSVGVILPRKITKLCRQQYKLINELVHMAQHAGLMPQPPKKEPKKPYQLLNTYYDETTIKLKTYKKPMGRFERLKLGPIEKLRVKPELYH